MIDTAQVEATIARYRQRERERTRNRRLIQQGRALAADSPERVQKFLARRGYGKDEVAAIMRQPRRRSRAARPPVALERVLGTNDLIGVAFLERGLGVARASLVEFDYQVGLGGAVLPTTTFAFDPDEFFFADENLDYAVVAVRSASTGGQRPSDFGWNPLVEEEGKTIVSQWLNLIQHPNGETKQLGLRENQLLDVLEEFLHYETDTAPGSSGSPVYNDRWEVVALHHSGVWDTNAAGQILAIDGRVWRGERGEGRI